MQVFHRVGTLWRNLFDKQLVDRDLDDELRSYQDMLADENARLRDLVLTLNKNLQQASIENNSLRRSLDGARANVKRERERNVAQLFVPANLP